MKALIEKYLKLYSDQRTHDVQNTLRCDGALEALTNLSKEVEDGQQSDTVPAQDEAPTKATKRKTRSKNKSN